MPKKSKPARRKAQPSAPRFTAEDKKFMAQSDLRTLREANDIRVDTRRMKAAERMAKEEMAALKKIRKA